MSLPSDYEERVYAGVLGKIIGVYLGRPFEGWSNRRIEEELGEVWYYVHEKRGVPLIVTDDDISGTFTFPRAFADNGYPYDITAEQVGRTWLNYLIENRTVLWWGGMGNSTEHTAYLRLKAGIPAPRSGSIELNGTVVAEQIGAQIFIDGWAMLCPGDPEKAAALARKAASVSHDGEAIHGAQVIAAMEAQAFVENDLNALLDTALTFIPRASLIYQLAADLREWHAADPRDWRATLRRIDDKWGYARYGGGCHMLPNHALILLGLLYGENDFQRSLMITNTAGWDTDCNSGNVGCLLGIKNGLDGLHKGPDWRGPVADRMYLPTADGGRCITDAVRETYALVNTARAMQGMRPVTPNQGMRYHFAFPGSVQGFLCEDSAECRGVVTIENVPLGKLAESAGAAADKRALALRYRQTAPGRCGRVATPTFCPPDALKMAGYGVYASPTLHPGQTLRARVVADPKNARPAQVGLHLRVYGRDNRLEVVRGPKVDLAAGTPATLTWQIPDQGGRPIAEAGIEIGAASGEGTVYLDWMGWSGVPDVTLGAPADNGNGSAWLQAWVNAADRLWSWERGYRLLQDRGTGLALYGDSGWSDYSVSTTLRAHLAEAIGIAVCVRGLYRYTALEIQRDGRVRFVLRYDDVEAELAEGAVPWILDHDYQVTVRVRRDGSLQAEIDDGERIHFVDAALEPALAHGGVGLLATVGHCLFGPVRIAPLA